MSSLGGNTPNILNEIVAAKRREVERLKHEVALPELERRIEGQPPPLNLSGALMGDSVRVIAEVKKASPARGLLGPGFDPASLAKDYAGNGAAAVSVLTNADHFQGRIEDMEVVQAVAGPLGLPVLRKEFIFDPYQVYESRAFGADALLLVVSILAPRTLSELLRLSQRLWMQCLVEVHDEEEVKVALDAGAEIVGINNRDLRTFVADLEVTERLASLVPPDKIVVSESGIHDREDVLRVGRAGARAVLVGEALVTAPDPGAKLRELL